MTLRKRRVLFLLFTALFAVLGALIVAYSYGWRFNFKNFAFQKTGAIYIESEPGDAYIEINGRPVKNKSWLLSGGTLVADLLPADYEVRVFKNGYFPWRKKLTVQPSLVAEASSIVLAPEADKGTEIEDGASRFWLKGENLIWADGGGELWAGIGKRVKVPGEAVVGFSADADYLLTVSSSTYFLANLNQPESFLNVNVLFNNLKERQLKLPGSVPVAAAVFHPFDGSRLILATRRALYLLDTSRLKLEIIADSPAAFLTAKNSEAVWLSSGAEPQLYSYNLILRTKALLAENLSGEAVEIAFSPDNDYLGLLFRNGLFLLLKRGSGKVETIPYSAKTFVFSPDSKKIAFLGRDGGLGVYFLADSQNDARKKAGDMVELTFEGGAGAEKIFWYRDSSHLFTIGSSLYFTEIDDRPPLNAYKLGDGVSQFWYEDGRDFYLLEAGRLILKKI